MLSDREDELIMVTNEGKKLEIATAQGDFLRCPIKTHVVVKVEDLLDIYVKPHILPEDMLFISEKVVAITQGRASCTNSCINLPMALGWAAPGRCSWPSTTSACQRFFSRRSARR